MADGRANVDDETPVTLFAQNGRVFVWNPGDAFKIRTKYRIVGSLVGSLPRKPRQNACFSLPLVLMAEETMLLLEKGFAKIVDSSGPFPAPMTEQVKAFKEMRETSVRDQLDLFRHEREERKAELAEVIEAGRRAKKKRRRRAADESVITEYEQPLKVPRLNDSFDCTNTVANPLKCNHKEKLDCELKLKEEVTCKNVLQSSAKNIKSTEPEGKREEIRCEETVAGKELQETECEPLLKILWQSDLPLPDVANTEMKSNKSEMEEFDKINKEEFCEIETKHDNKREEEIYEKAIIETDRVNDKNTSIVLPNQDLSEQNTFIHIPTSIPADWIPNQEFRWTYPESQTDRLHYRVFSDLWEKGYYLTSGGKFGGQYLAYPGDPTRFHSFFIVVTIPWGEKVSPFDIISIGRLGATVRKTAVLSSVNEDGEVVYTSLKWSGIS